MKVIQSGDSLRIHTDHIQLYDQLPARGYVIRFYELSGFCLEEYEMCQVNEKIYGKMPGKVPKVLNTFKKSEKSLGVILSGNKGIGKTSFAKLVCEEAMKRNLPVIVVDKYIPGIHSFIEDIEQECLVLFDEFEKTFAIDQHEDIARNPQTTLLSLFDGISPGKKLYIITCNEIRRMDDYLINRPGRFHYHFRFDYPRSEEIRLYMQEHLEKEYWSEVEKVIAFSEKMELNYDCLRSIAFELNSDEPFEEIIHDLNILNITETSYDIFLHLTNGEVWEDSGNRIDFFSSIKRTFANFYRDGEYSMSGKGPFMISFNPQDHTFDSMTKVFTIPADKVTLSSRSDGGRDDGRIKFEEIKVQHLRIQRCAFEDKYQFSSLISGAPIS